MTGMVDPQEVIGPRLRALRLALGIKTQKAFAEAIGVEKNTYNPWEKGTRPLTFEGACLIRKKFNIPLDYQFYGQLDGVPAWLRPQLLQQSAA
jgi:transcriptional regulator with XRE-family HTH domain